MQQETSPATKSNATATARPMLRTQILALFLMACLSPIAMHLVACHSGGAVLAKSGVYMIESDARDGVIKEGITIEIQNAPEWRETWQDSTLKGQLKEPTDYVINDLGIPAGLRVMVARGDSTVGPYNKIITVYLTGKALAPLTHIPQAFTITFLAGAFSNGTAPEHGSESHTFGIVPSTATQLTTPGVWQAGKYTALENPQNTYPNANSRMGFNGESLATGEMELPFANSMKQAGRARSTLPGVPWGVAEPDPSIKEAFNEALDSDGYPMVNHPGGPPHRYAWIVFNNVGGVHLQEQGTWVFKWDGYGRMELSGAAFGGVVNGTQNNLTSDATTPGRIEFTMQAGDLLIHLDDIDPANYPTNYVLCPLAHEALVDSGEWMNPNWVEKLEMFRVARFMLPRQIWYPAWQGLQTYQWDDRPLPSHIDWSIMPLEVTIDYANQTNTIPWVNIPTQYNDDSIAKMATALRDNLDPQLELFLEWGNEIWGPGSNANEEAQNWAQTDPDSAAPAWRAQHGHAFRALRAYEIFAQTFGAAEMASRVKFVVGTQAGWVAPTHALFDTPKYGAALAERTESLGVGLYWGASISNLQDKDAFMNQAATPQAIIEKLVADSGNPSANNPFVRTYQESIQWMDMQQTAMDRLENLSPDFITYESGPEFINDGLESDPEINDVLDRVNETPSLLAVYQDFWDAYKALPETQWIVTFSNAAPRGQKRRFGHFQSADLPIASDSQSGKLQTMQSWNAANPASTW